MCYFYCNAVQSSEPVSEFTSCRNHGKNDYGVIVYILTAKGDYLTDSLHQAGYKVAVAMLRQILNMLITRMKSHRIDIRLWRMNFKYIAIYTYFEVMINLIVKYFY
jgi:hypothetical protein